MDLSLIHIFIRALLIVIILLVAIAFVSYLVNKDKPATSETILINEVMAGNKQAVTCLLYTS